MIQLKPIDIFAEPTLIELLDIEPSTDDLRVEVLTRLSATRKTLPCKLFYDQHGSNLFDAICELPEYYPTRTELSIMREYATSMAEAIGPRALLVEYGSGSSLKTRVLLDQLPDLAGYVPTDISRVHLMGAAQSLAASYPHLAIRPVCADYTRPFRLPSFEAEAPQRTVAYFPGSTIGNFEPTEALTFLRSVRGLCGPRGGLLIGVDLKKDPNVLHAAYNDANGLTAEFNLNILRRINRDIGADFDLTAFTHYALYNPTLGRMEMHLVSQKPQRVDLGDGLTVDFASGESIHTESCYKYTNESFTDLVSQAGYRTQAVWTDPHQWFSVHYLTNH